MALALALAACGDDADKANRPALWEVTGPGNAHGFVFGTVHALPDGLAWKTPAIDAAVARSDSLVLEIVDPADEAAARAALTLSFALEANNGYEPANGADRALRAAAGERPVTGLETLAGQLGLFDALAPREQRALLEAVVAEGGDEDASRRLIAAWASGDVTALDRLAHEGMMANPRLREPLLAARNRAWAGQVAAMLRAGRRPFVAVGAAHVVGIDGLPALLQAEGFELRRVQ
ncbi:MAG: TraB/GumN family protein [Novosphingobium sp.]|nr:TraB/GumN family protein [Novosphingobium sp.]